MNDLSKHVVNELIILLGKEIQNLEFHIDYFKGRAEMNFEPMIRRVRRLKKIREKLESS